MPAAAIVPIASLALSALGTGMSFGQASKQRKAEQKAIRAAEAAMEQARKRLEVNYLDALAIQKEPYELEREALLVAGAQGIEAARESERGAAAGVGRIQLAQQRGQQGIRSAMGREMTALDKAAAAEDSKIRDAQAQLDLGEAAGAQMAAANASKAAAAAQSQGFQQLASLGVQALETAPLYAKSPEARQFAQSQRQAVRADKANYMQGSGKGKGFLGIGTGYNQFAPKTPELTGFNVSGFSSGGVPTITGANFAGGKDFALSNFQKNQFAAIDPTVVSQINKAGLSESGEMIGQIFDPSAIQSMTPEQLDAYMVGLTPGQMNLINQAIGRY